MDFMLKNKIENGNVKGFKRMVFKILGLEFVSYL